MFAKHRRKLWAPLIPLLLIPALSGCGAKGQHFQAFQPIPSETAEVIVYRPDKLLHGGVPYYVYIDGKEVGTLRNAGYIIVQTKAGDHQLKVQAGFEDIYKEVSAPMAVELGQRRIYRFEPSAAGIFLIGTNTAYLPVGLGLWQVNEDQAFSDLSSLRKSE